MTQGIEFDHERAVQKLKNWWSMTGSLEGFAVIIAKEEVVIDGQLSDEKSEEDEFIKQLKDCKASVFDISREAQNQ